MLIARVVAGAVAEILWEAVAEPKVQSAGKVGEGQPGLGVLAIST
jgi:hypothetical protein